MGWDLEIFASSKGFSPFFTRGKWLFQAQGVNDSRQIQQLLERQEAVASVSHCGVFG